jgi:hypothetical protein
MYTFLIQCETELDEVDDDDDDDDDDTIVIATQYFRF